MCEPVFWQRAEMICASPCGQHRLCQQDIEAFASLETKNVFSSFSHVDGKMRYFL
jgi:hypothetical protein